MINFPSISTHEVIKYKCNIQLDEVWLDVSITTFPMNYSQLRTEQNHIGMFETKVSIIDGSSNFAEWPIRGMETVSSIVRSFLELDQLSSLVLYSCDEVFMIISSMTMLVKLVKNFKLIPQIEESWYCAWLATSRILYHATHNGNVHVLRIIIPVSWPPLTVSSCEILELCDSAVGERIWRWFDLILWMWRHEDETWYLVPYVKHHLDNKRKQI